jgi:hypothetical protein
MARRKWFTYLLDKRVTCKRNTPTKDASGGDVDDFQNISGAVNVWAGIQGFERVNETNTDFARPDGFGEFKIFFDRDLGLRNGDKIVHGSAQYHVVGVPDDASNANLADGPYQVKATRRQA